MPTRIEISFKTILFILSALIGLAFIWKIKNIILLLFIALIMVSALRYPVEWLVVRKVPKVLSIVFVYLILFVFLVGVVVLVVPPLMIESSKLFDRLPFLVEQINNLIIFYQIPTNELVSNFTQQFTSLGTKFTVGIFGVGLAFVTLVVLTFYLLLDWKKIIKLTVSIFSGQQEKKALKIIDDIESGLGGWVRGQVTLSFIVAILVFVGLSILGVQTALPLAIIAGLLEIIPIIGPIIAAIPGLLVALTISPVLAIATGAMYFIIQQLENHIIVPTVMARSAGVNPIITIISLMIGAQLAGLVGALIAVPTAITIKVLVRDLLAPQINLTKKELEELEEIDKETA